jgi:hypothetical protein
MQYLTLMTAIFSVYLDIFEILLKKLVLIKLTNLKIKYFKYDETLLFTP